MTRLHADPVEVRTRVEAAGPVPEEFLWRGRRYVVREVLARWTASGAWWQGRDGQGRDGQAPGGTIDDTEQSWWRVETDSGRLAALSGGRGTYDLCLSWARGTWTLQRVLD
jgi:hypothetical protein